MKEQEADQKNEREHNRESVPARLRYVNVSAYRRSKRLLDPNF